MMLGLVVYPHMICDISRREQFATDMTWNFVLMSDHMSTQPVFCGKCRLACLQKAIRRVLTHANLHHFYIQYFSYAQIHNVHINLLRLTENIAAVI